MKRITINKKEILEIQGDYFEDQVIYFDFGGNKYVVYLSDLKKELVDSISVGSESLNTYVNELSRKVWSTEDDDLVTPLDVINNNISKGHLEAIKRADLDNPILVLGNTGIILDGFHRLAKAFMLGKNNIKVKRLSIESVLDLSERY